MTTKVNGGVKAGFWTEGALQFYTLTTPANVLDFVIATDGVTVVANSALDVMLNVISQKANVVGVEYVENTDSVKVALAHSAWTAATLTTAFDTIGVAEDGVATFNRYTSAVSDVVVADTADFDVVVATAGAAFVGTAT